MAHTGFKGISEQQQLKNYPRDSNRYQTRGGPSFNLSRTFSNLEQPDVDPVWNVLLLIQVKQGQVLKGQAHPSLEAGSCSNIGG